ncbi:hypothetical protein MKW94_022975 [Papaver nudicaule]|uniref:DUF8039 domain-containing protein n=1 Tax=Papaver nudicaule TaxID=74823 RepID=A0AA41VBM2_PAPNU|nr:hypothetical protein [Papaver nudicaule]
MTPRRSSPRFKNISKEPDCVEKTSPTRSPLGKRKLSVEPEKSQPLQSASGASEAAAFSTEVVNKLSKAKRKLYSGPCPNVQLVNPNDTLEDMLDDEENEENDEHEPENDVAEREVENEDKENENEGEDHDTGKVQEAEERPKRKYVPRGPTRMKALGLTVDKNDTKNKKDGKQILSFNSKDQPIGDPSVALASVLGVLVRRNIALKNLDWRDVPGDTKNNLWAIVKQRFIVDDFYKDYYIGKMGGYLKEARSRKARKILALDGLEEEERVKKLEALKPKNDTVAEWEEFVKHVCSDEFRANRLRMQGVRKQYITPHTISRKGYARLEAELLKDRSTEEEIDSVELWKVGHQQKEGKEPNACVVEALEKLERAQEEQAADVGSSVTVDVLAKALGDEKPGKIRGVGYGVTKTKMVVKSHYKKIIKECQVNMMEMNQRLAQLESGNASNNHDVPSTSKTVAHHENGSPVSRPRVEEVLGNGKACRLLSWYNDDEVVADAVIVDTNPKGKCHGHPIGFGAYKVTVTVSHVDDAELFKQSNVLKTVYDAVGTFTTWSKDLILPAISTSTPTPAISTSTPTPTPTC